MQRTADRCIVRSAWSAIATWAVAAALSLVFANIATAEDDLSSTALIEQLRGLKELRSVLHVAAHPDDENTLLITYLARGRHVRTAYLSITRGDGGQNVLGPEFGEELGLIRTQELLAARRLDGGRQFFTRAIDFGFSKDYQETLRIWDEQAVLSDVVRVIRTFQPDVIVTRFSPQASRTHGHHTASAVLAVAAFKLAGDPGAFPEQLKDLKPWQAKRVLMNGGDFGRGGTGNTASTASVRMDISGADPVLKQSFAKIAGDSRAMHKSQGFGNFGGGGRDGARTESFQLLAGEPAKDDIFDGIDGTWSRIPGGEGIDRQIDSLIAKFNPQRPVDSVPDLLSLRSELAALPSSNLVYEKQLELDRILQACLGLTVETTVAHAEVVPGEKLELNHRVKVSSQTPIKWLGVRYPDSNDPVGDLLDLKPDAAAERRVVRTLAANMPLSQPYWMREAAAAGTYRVSDASLIGRPENPPAFPVEYVFEVRGQRLAVSDEPVEVIAESGKPTIRRRLEVVAPVVLSFDYDVASFVPGVSREVRVQVAAVRSQVSGELKLQSPSEWKVEPAQRRFQIAAAGKTTALSFTVTPSKHPGSAELVAEAQIGGATFRNRRIEIDYPHIPPLLLQPTARLKAVALDLAIRGQVVGYLPGAGDSVAECLEQMGYKVKHLNADDLTEEGLRGLDAVVIGVRAFNVRSDLAPHLPALFTYCQAGGNVIVQYNRPDGQRANGIAPYELRISQDRVTDENSPVTLVAPDHPALNTPNKITLADFDGWVQERGIYFPGQWDEHFTPLIACNDPGESPLKGGILVAPYGHGYFVYTSLVWFRQLPAGVPGAYRLFANLVSLGKE
jgi:LmbE family N-acetylglucosaminyl deacetylase